jgi:hypothetical protein
LKRNNKIEMDFIWEGLPDPVREKFGKCSSTKELWDKLHNLYFEKSPITNQRMLKKMQNRTRRNMLIMSDRFIRRIL